MAARAANHSPLGLVFTAEFSMVSALPGRFLCISHLAQGAWDGRDHGVPSTGRKSGLQSKDSWGCSEMTEAKPDLERKESRDRGESS